MRLSIFCSLALSMTSVTGGFSQESTPTKRHDVEIVRDLKYNDRPDATANPKQKLDLYFPKDVKNYPVIMFVHGGGYQRGDKHEGENFGKILASRGVGVAVISYRLFPEVKHPGHIEDVATAFAWLKKNIAKHNGNSNAIFVSGHSAGAHLVSLLATDQSFLKARKLNISDIKGVLAISGGYRIQPIRKEVFGDEKIMEKASPFSHLSSGHPPFLIIYGGDEKQERHDLSNEFRDALRKAGGQAECLKIPDRDHQGLFAKIGEGDSTTDSLVDFVKRSVK